jgi:Rieske Fe-S protein
MCAEEHERPDNPARRRLLSRAVLAIQAVIAAGVAFVAGAAMTAPAFGRRASSWWPAGPLLDDLVEGDPMPVTISRSRQDGYTRVADRQVVFLVKTGVDTVTALSSTCTHLGCRVRWDAADRVLKCPCHGGVFDRTGAVLAGPPSAPLATLATRLEDGRVLVELS